MLKFLKRFLTADGIFVGFVEGISKTQLRCYHKYQESFPEKSKYELYIEVISDRPGYIRQDAEFIEVINGYFFKKAAHGETFGPLSRIEERFGKSLEENYGLSEGPFINVAKTYWTYKLELGDLSAEYSNVVLYTFLSEFEVNIASVFFPTQGPVGGPSVSQRKEMQRQLLQRFAPEIDIERFLSENPALRDKSGCFGTIILTFLLVSRAFVFFFS